MAVAQKDRTALRWLLAKGKRLIPMLSVLLIFNVLLSASAVVFSLVSREIVDSAVGGNKERLIAFAIGLLGVIVAQLLLRLGGRWMEETLRARVEILLKKSLFSSMLTRNYADLSAHHSGDLMTRLTSDISVIANGAATILPRLVSMLTQLVFALSVLIAMDSGFAVVFVAGGVVLLLTTRLFRRVMKRMHKRVQETDGKMRSFLQEGLENLLVVKVFSAERRTAEKAEGLMQENYTAHMKRRNISVLAGSGFSFVFHLGYLYAMVWGSLSILNGTLTYGTLTAIIQLVGQVQMPFANLSGIIPQYFSLVASCERVMEIETMAGETVEEHRDAAEMYRELESFEFRRLTFAYSRDTVFENADLSVKKGEFVAICGISGIGKSTLLKLLLGVYQGYEGEIVLRARTREYAADASTRPLFAYVPQGNLLFSGTIRENLTFLYDRVDQEALERALYISCAEEFLSDLPQGLDTVIGEKGSGLSEGQVQRLAIARALLGGAPVLLLDEATSALDEQTEARFLNRLREIDGVTCLIITHKRAALDICDRCIHIAEKQIAEGLPQEEVL